MKIKVAFVLGALNRGGMESLILDICRRADECPFEVVCIYRKEGNFSEEFHKTQARMIHIPKTGNIIGYMYKLRRMILAEKIDIVHSQTPSNTMVLGIALLGNNIKLITTFHSLLFAHANSLMRRWVYCISRKIICVSEYQKQYYQSQWNLSSCNKFQVVYNGIDTSKMTGMDYPIPEFLQDNYDGSISLVVIGSFRIVRSQIFLLKVVNQLQNMLREKHVKIYFIGGVCKGEESFYTSCEIYIKENHISDIAILKGIRKDIFAILQHADGFLYSSNKDTFGIAVVEAMLNGTPVIVNDFEVMKEITQNGTLALLYKSNQVDDCANKILNFIDEVELYKVSAQEQIPKVKKMYSIENHINNLYKIYTDL